MADRPFDTPLPADLPEDWTSGQIVAPAGVDVGLSKQHGYNYLMEQVNAAQRAANAINESFDTISGKRTCRFVIGTSTAGWTQADCDYLCDGTDDQEEIQAAISAAPTGGCEIVLLDGTYHFSQPVILSPGAEGGISIVGNPGATVFQLSSNFSIPFLRGVVFCWSFSGITFECTAPDAYTYFSSIGSNVSIQNCVFHNVRLSLSSGQEKGDAMFFRVIGNRIFFDVDATSNLLYLSLSASAIPVYYHVSANTLIHNGNADNSYILDCSCSGSVYGAISNNTMRCTGTGGQLQANGNRVLLSGNELSGIVAAVNGSGLVSSNHITDGGLVLGAYNTEKEDHANRLTASGNFLYNSALTAYGCSVVSGNVVAAEDEGPSITVFKFSANSVADLNPAITGNFICGSGVGVLLQDPHFQTSRTASKVLITGNRFRGCATPVKIESWWNNCMVTDNLFDAGAAVVDEGADNIIRMNSNDPDPGSGGGGTAGVSSFNGRTGAVAPQAGDYTAVMVGAIPTGAVSAIQAVTQAEYDALATKNASTLYLIKE